MHYKTAAQVNSMMSRLPRLLHLLAFTICFSSLAIVHAEDGPTNSAHFISQPLSLFDAIDVALHQNPALRRARKELEAAHGIVIQSRAVLLPKLRLTGAFNALEDSDVDKPPATIPGFSFGTDKNWATELRIVQSIYEGGRMAWALRVGRLTADQALLNYQT